MLLLALFLLFTVGPLVELSLLIYLWSHVGGWATVGLVLFTGIVGAALARWQGVRAVMRVQRRVARGQMPAEELFDGVLILVAGVVLVTPGVLTDLLGFALLIPPIRSVVKRLLRRWATQNLEVRTTQVNAEFWGPAGSPLQRDEIVDVEVIETRIVD